jgi:hypothetical protein
MFQHCVFFLLVIYYFTANLNVLRAVILALEHWLLLAETDSLAREFIFTEVQFISC